MAPEIETHLVNAVLTNGARYYVDHAHPELSTPECADARSIVVFDKAAELILRRSMDAARALLPEGQEIVVYKNNSDGKGNSYGCHENYLMDRAVPFGQIVTHATAHFVTRQIFTGAGKVGSEVAGHRRRRGAVPAHPAGRLLRGGGRPRDHAEAADRQHPRRAARRRPEVPPPPRHRRRRQHLRGRHLPQGRHHRHRAGHDRGRRPAPRVPVRRHRCRRCARSPTTSRCADRSSSSTAPPSPPSRCSGSCSTGPASTPRPTASTRSAARSGHEVLAGGRRSSPASRPTRCRSPTSSTGWPRTGCSTATGNATASRWDDARLAAMDLQYHDLRPEQVAVRRGRPRADHRRRRGRAGHAAAAHRHPGLLPGHAASQRWPDDIVAANWDSLVFDIGSDPLRRVPMMEPTRGTEAHVGPLLDRRCRAARRPARAASRLTPDVGRRSDASGRSTRRHHRRGTGSSRARAQRCTMAEREQIKKQAPARRPTRSSRTPRRPPRPARSSRPSSTISSTRSTRSSRPTPRTS